MTAAHEDPTQGKLAGRPVWVRSRLASGRTAEGLVVGAAAIAVVSAVIALLNQFLPLLSLTGLYLFAIVPVAIGWGFLVAGIVAVASSLTFAYFIAPPVHSFRVAESDTATAFVISIITAYVVSELARRVQAGANEARLRAQQAEQAQRGQSRLAEEQAALRRVATLVAADAPSSELFRAVAAEAGTLLAADLAALVRYEPEDAVYAVAGWGGEGEEPEIAGRWPTEPEGLAATISTTAQPARQDGWEGVPGAFAAFVRGKLGVRSSVGSPIVVEGRVWGALFLHSRRRDPFPPDTESRLADFTDLVATSMAHAQARAEVRRLADEQTALRRVATLVANAVPISELFEAVTREVGLQCDADLARMERFEPHGEVTAIAAWARESGSQLAVGKSFPLEGASIAAEVYETGRPARVDTYVGASGPIAHEAQLLGIRSSVGCPITVGGRAWGVIAASTRREEPFPPNTESRISDFTELVATAVSNAEARADLVASRARLLTEGDEARRRVVRDLHDGAQQSLVTAILTLKGAHEQEDHERARALLGEALDHAEQANAELRELAHGILPAALARGGLAAGVKALVRRLHMPVSVDVPSGRFPAEIEASAYFVVAEALTNVSKHSGARSADVTAWIEDSVLRVDVRDDGVGGARRDGNGLLGLDDRVAALGGQLRIDSPPGRGTLIAVALPINR